MPIPMTEDEIWMIIEAFGKAAGRARKAGFTGVEIHGANSYILQQFFSPYSNKRTDKWGGDLRCDRCDQHEQHTELETCHRLTNRARFATEVVKAVRGEVGSDYPICYRITPEEPEPDGYSAYDTIELLRLIVPLGIDIVHVSTTEYGVPIHHHYPEGTHPTLLIRRALPPSIPVIGVGSVVHPDRAMRILDDGINLVALGRALLMDPDWLPKAKEGRIDSIKKSLSTADERFQLLIPEPMKEYVVGRLPISPA